MTRHPNKTKYLFKLIMSSVLNAHIQNGRRPDKPKLYLGRMATEDEHDIDVAIRPNGRHVYRSQPSIEPGPCLGERE